MSVLWDAGLRGVIGYANFLAYWVGEEGKIVYIKKNKAHSAETFRQSVVLLFRPKNTRAKKLRCLGRLTRGSLVQAGSCLQ